MKKIDFTLKNEMKNNFFGRKDLCVLVAARKIDITFLGLLNWNAKKNEILMRSFASPSSTFAIIIRAVGTGAQCVEFKLRGQFYMHALKSTYKL